MTDDPDPDADSQDGDGYVHRSLADVESTPEKPGRRWELSPSLGIEGYNVNVAVLEPDQRLSENAYHVHRDQSEFYYVVEGRLRVEVPEGSFDANADDVVRFEPGVPHLLHNPFDEQCKVVAIGHPPEGRYPVEQVRSYEELLEERYGDEAPD